MTKIRRLASSTVTILGSAKWPLSLRRHRSRQWWRCDQVFSYRVSAQHNCYFRRSEEILGLDRWPCSIPRRSLRRRHRAASSRTGAGRALDGMVANDLACHCDAGIWPRGGAIPNPLEVQSVSALRSFAERGIGVWGALRT